MTWEQHRVLAWVPCIHVLQLIASEAPERYPKSLLYKDLFYKDLLLKKPAVRLGAIGVILLRL